MNPADVSEQDQVWSAGWRFVSEGEAPIALVMRERHEDFVVHELPSFEASGEGEHLFLLIEKRGMTTPDVARRLVREYDVERKDVGWAGRKDARALTQQWFSVRGASSENAERLNGEDLRVLQVTRNDRKLRLGALRGNRFQLLLRGIAEDDRERAERVLRTIEREGLPNFFGSQRFGVHGQSFELGRLLLEGRARQYLLARLGPLHSPGHPHVAELRAVIEEGRRSSQRQLGELAPKLVGDYAALARQLARRPGDWRSALRALDRATLGMHLAGWQSLVFNRVLARRFDHWTEPQVGDLLQLAGSGSVFEVSDTEDLQELAQRTTDFELSISGPLPGQRAPLASGVPGELELEAIREAGAEAGALDPGVRGLTLPGTRRPLRIRVKALEWSWSADGLHLDFELPPGSYATVLVAELSKKP